MEKKKSSLFRGALLLFSALGLIGAAAVHISTFQGINLQQRFPLVVLLHIGGIVAIGGLVGLSVYEKHEQNEFFDVLVRPVWPVVLLVLLGAYAGFNFFTSIGEGGSYEAKKGKYVRTYRGDIRKTYKDKVQWKKDKKRAELGTARGFSGHSMFFFGAVFIFLIAGRGRKKQPKVYAMLPPETITDLLRQKKTLALPDSELLNWDERLRQGTPWVMLRNVIGVQVVILAAVGAIFQVWIFLFAAAFISINFTNYYFYKKYVKDFIKSISFRGDTCEIELLRGDERDVIEIPFESLRVKVEEVRTKGGMAYTLKIERGEETVVEQRAKVGFWDKERIKAAGQGLIPHVQNMPPKV